ncbi:hypothetical protein F5Y17DRAFT_477748 [Xylariaceae sp. FL0594]|nr:hypothetical protein F5Y17DRAFT_477748 [Xylariaceae sp. FL0594]
MGVDEVRKLITQELDGGFRVGCKSLQRQRAYMEPSNGIPIASEYKTCLDDGQIAIVPTDDWSGLPPLRRRQQQKQHKQQQPQQHHQRQCRPRPPSQSGFLVLSALSLLSPLFRPPLSRRYIDLNHPLRPLLPNVNIPNLFTSFAIASTAVVSLDNHFLPTSTSRNGLFRSVTSKEEMAEPADGTCINPRGKMLQQRQLKFLNKLSSRNAISIFLLCYKCSASTEV